jgi:DNA-binding MarR family transcriptional regulator
VKTRPKRVPANDTGYKLYEQVGYILRQVSQRHMGIFSDQITDLTPTQFAALAKLCEWRSISQNELGRQTSMDASTIKGVVDRLRNRGYLETQPDQRDHRRLILSPSAQGERVFADLVTVASDITAKTLEPLTKKEQDQFLRLLSKLK